MGHTSRAAFSSSDALVLPILRWTIRSPLSAEDAALRLASLVTSDDDPRDDPHRPLRGSVSFGTVRLRRATRWGAPLVAFPDAATNYGLYPPWYYVSGTIRDAEAGSLLRLWLYPTANSGAALLGSLAFFGVFAYASLAIPELSIAWALGPFAAHLFVQWRIRVSVGRTRAAIVRAFAASPAQTQG